VDGSNHEREGKRFGLGSFNRGNSAAIALANVSYIELNLELLT